MKIFKIFLNVIFLKFIKSNILSQALEEDSISKRHKEQMDVIMQKPKYPIKTIGILLYDGYQTLDAMGPYEVLSQIGGGVKVFFIGKNKGFIRNQHGMKVLVDTSISKVKQLDILVIPGGAVETFIMTQDSSVLNWIRSIDKVSTYTTSVCTGAWILGATGLLKGKEATTNWYRAEEMINHYGGKFEAKRWVHDGKYWTSAGVTAGIDMSLAIIDDLMGEKFCQAVMLNLEYDPQPPITGGSVKNTPPLIKEMMENMYDLGLKPFLNEQNRH